MILDTIFVDTPVVVELMSLSNSPMRIPIRSFLSLDDDDDDDGNEIDHTLLHSFLDLFTVYLERERANQSISQSIKSKMMNVKVNDNESDSDGDAKLKLCQPGFDGSRL
jgi:competence protein ComGF